MSIVIKDVCMPECCTKCFCYIGVCGGICTVGDNGWYRTINSGLIDIQRMDWCPLKEVEDEEE